MSQNKLYFFLFAIACYSNMALSETPVASGGWQSSNRNVIADPDVVNHPDTGMGEQTFNFQADRPFATKNTKEFKRDVDGRYLEYDVDRVNLGTHLNIKLEKPLERRGRDRRPSKRLDSIGNLDAPKVDDDHKIGLELRR